MENEINSSLKKSQETENPYIKFSFRGKKRMMRKDTLEPFPFLYALIDREWRHNHPVDDDSYIVDEDYQMIALLADLFRAWVELNKPLSIDTCGLVMLKVVDRGLLASIARRMGCDDEFVKTLLNPADIIDEKNLFNCYYCGKTFLKGERLVMKECAYHMSTCSCSDRTLRYHACARVPFHTPVPLGIARKKLEVRGHLNNYSSLELQ
jgi:hypothetical protein